MKRGRSYNREETRNLGRGFVIACAVTLLLILCFLRTVVYIASSANLQVPVSGTLKMPLVEDDKSPSQSDEDTKIERQEVDKPICDFSGPRSNVCDVKGDVRVHGNSTTVFVANSHISNQGEEWRIRPYARKHDNFSMSKITEILIKPLMHDQHQSPHCTKNHTVPAVIFSIGAYTGNLFHDFTDVLVPLFITSNQFDGEVQFIITDVKPWWLNKFRLIIKQLSRYEIIDIKRDKDVHCFQRAIVGTMFHKELGIDPLKSPNGYSMLEFKDLLKKSFSLEKDTAIQIGDKVECQKPRLLIISRKRTRKFINEREIVEMGKSLGYDVVVAEPEFNMDVSKFARLVNSFDVMMGVHGAGLTNMLFLPRGAVLIQVVPFGRVEWIARGSFGLPAADMRVKYLEYSIQEEESTLIEQYPHEHSVLRDPLSVRTGGWPAIKSVYLDKQNVKPHLGRLKNTLLEAMNLLRQQS